jgi:polar amino acid transport system substrate-binding protein
MILKPIAFTAAILLAAPAAFAGDAQARRELLPTSALRVGIGVGPAKTAFWSATDPASGRPSGVAVDLGAALARKLGVPVAYVVYANSGELTESSGKGEWDVTFLPVDAERIKKVDFGPDYYLFVSTFLVAPGSSIRTLAEVDRPGVRVAGVENTTTIRSARRVLKTAEVASVASGDELFQLLRQGRVDAVAMGRDGLETMAARLPGARVLDGHFHAAGTAPAVPKGRAAALAYLTTFIEDAKADGTVRRILDAHGIKGPVAPPASR